MHRRVVRGYTRISGVQKGHSNKLRASGFSILIIAGVIGVCGLATMATQQTDRFVAATANQKSAPLTASIDTQTQASNTAPATPLPSSQASGSTAETGATSRKGPGRSPLPACNIAQRSAAIAKRGAQSQSEAARHEQVLWSLQTTGLVAKFFNPNMYNSKLSQEDTYHATITAQIQHTYRAALARAFCTT